MDSFSAISTTDARINDCWHRIGVEGDRSCPELSQYIHCHHCPVYAATGRSLLEREAPGDYIQEWTEVIAQQQPELELPKIQGRCLRTKKMLSLVIFWLAGELLALPVSCLQEITTPCTVHTLPHRSDELFLGLVNIRGEILLCVALDRLLELERSPLANPSPGDRLVVIQERGERWVFAVDEVCGVYRFAEDSFSEVPAVISRAAQAYTTGIVRWQEQQISILDSQLLFSSLNRRIL